jgi:hypothetical protein
MAKCNAVDRAWFGRRQLWLLCSYERWHEGPHRDSRHKEHYWSETFYEEEIERGRPIKVPTKKVRLCKKCGKERRTDGANDACVCKETGANKRQSIMFADEREKLYRQAALRDLEDDIAWLMDRWKKEADEDGYHGAF